MDLLQQMTDYMQAHHMTEPGACVLVALSGGPDSVALLHLLHRYSKQTELRLCAAHLHHGIRAKADEDAQFVTALCDTLGIPLRIQRRDVPAMAQKQHISIELAARQARWDFLFDAAAQMGCSRIATAHHMDDQAETVLLRLIRGTGIAGLAGMRPVENQCIRPLLWAQKTQLLTYLQEQALTYCTDETNGDETIARNYVRHTLLPHMERLNPQVRSALARTAEQMRLHDGALQAQTRQFLAQCPPPEGDSYLLPATQLLCLEEELFSRVIRAAAAQLGVQQDIGAVHIQAIYRLCQNQTGTALNLPHGLRASRQYDTLRIERNFPRVPIHQQFPACVPGDTLLGEQLLRIVPVARPRQLQAPDIWYVDADRLPHDLCVRTRHSGDVVHPLGAPGSKKLKDYLIDRKVPRDARDDIWLLASENIILWAEGLCISHQVRVQPDTKRILSIQLLHAEKGTK